MAKPRTKEMLAVYLHDHKNLTLQEVIDVLTENFTIYSKLVTYDQPEPGQVYEGGNAHGKRRLHRIEQVEAGSILYQVLTEGEATYAPRWVLWSTFKENHYPQGRRRDLEQ